MLTTLKFVQGAVSSKTLVPEMSHFVIENGTIRSYNGRMALSSPIAIDLDCKPKAAAFVSAIGKCSDTVSLSMTPAGKLRIISGKFRAVVECIDKDVPHLEPSGDIVPLGGVALLDCFRTLSAFVGDDATRPWSGGVLLRGRSAFATNNVCLIEWWMNAPMPFDVNIPSAALREMIRIGEEPVAMQISKSNITFHYKDGRWVLTNLLSTEWPDLSRVLDRDCVNKPVKLHEKLFEGIETLKSFVDDYGRVYFREGMLRTHLSDEVGAVYELGDFPYEGCYRIEMLMKLKGVAKKIDFSAFPGPCLFFGDRLRGAIIGMRI